MDTEVLKSQISMPELLAKYGIYEGNKRRIPCPLHGGRNPNFAFNENSFICFKCDAKGDILTFTQMYFNISFPDAVKQLQQDFSISPPKTLREKYDIISRRKQKNAIQSEFERNMVAYEQALDYYSRLERQKKMYKPRVGEKPHPLFIDAIKNLAHADYELGRAEGRLINGTKR